MGSSILPMTLGDMLDKTVRVIGKTVWRNAAIAITFLIVPIVILAIAANRFYTFTPYGRSLTPVSDPSTFGPSVQNGMFFGSAYILFIVAMLLAEIGVSIVISAELNSRRVGYADAIRMTFDRRWISGIGEGVLKLMIFLTGGLVTALFIGALFVVARSATRSPGALAILLMVVLAMVPVCLMVYVALRLAFALTSVAVENLNPIEAFKKSWFLVGGHWWRTLGILIVFVMLSGLAVSVVSAPIMFGSMWSEYKELFTIIGKTHGQVNPDYFNNFQMGVSRMAWIGSGISSLLSILLTPAFTVVMYYDLRARHDDLPVTDPGMDNGDSPLVTY